MDGLKAELESAMLLITWAYFLAFIVVQLARSFGFADYFMLMVLAWILAGAVGVYLLFTVARSSSSTE